MFPWKNVYTILPKGIPVRLIILRQSCAAPLIFRKQDLIKYGVGREDMVGVFTCSSAFPRPRLRFFSAKSSQDKKESSVFQELVESQEQPQTQLTVGAKGLLKILINVKMLLPLNIILSIPHLFPNPLV